MKDDDFRLHFVLSAIANGANTLGEIARQAGGIYPLELKELLDELVLKGEVRYSQAGYSLATSETGNILEDWTPKRISLPEPHPLDYDWRFSISTARYLAGLVAKESHHKGAVLLLGAPSVFVEIILSKPLSHITLIDSSRELMDYLAQFELPQTVNVIAHNLMSSTLWETDKKFGVVVCDPPWYVEHYIAFLAQATHAASIGAVIILSLLPMNTRPNAIQDRWEILGKAQQLGLHIQGIENGRVEYETPEFELTSLGSAGIDTDGNWRKGDLVILRKVRNLSKGKISEIASSAYSASSNGQEWSEILIGKRKLKLRGPFDDYSVTPEIISIEKNDILPTVSRRYKGREAVDLWLWDNRVFGLRGKSSFWAALHTLAGRPIPESVVDVSEINHQHALILLKERIGLANDLAQIQVRKLSQIENELKNQGESLTIENLIQICKQFSINGHLAILTQPYLNRIMTREKTIESRFSKVRVPPFKAIHSGDVLFLKESSGPIRAIALVSKAEFFGPLLPGEADSIMQRYSSGLALEDTFRQVKQESKYVTLVHLGDVLFIKPIAIAKTDRRPWIILNYEDPNRLF